MTHGQRLLLAVGDRRNAIAVDPQHTQHALDRVAAAFAKRQIVLARAALISVTREINLDIRVGRQVGRMLLDDAA